MQTKIKTVSKATSSQETTDRQCRIRAVSFKAFYEKPNHMPHQIEKNRKTFSLTFMVFLKFASESRFDLWSCEADKIKLYTCSKYEHEVKLFTCSDRQRENHTAAVQLNSRLIPCIVIKRRFRLLSNSEILMLFCSFISNCAPFQ